MAVTDRLWHAFNQELNKEKQFEQRNLYFSHKSKHKTWQSQDKKML
jgi:hypothetical protein